MTNLNEHYNRLAHFHNALDPKSYLMGNGISSLSSGIFSYNGALPADKARALLPLYPDREQDTLLTAPRWLSVTYPAGVSKAVGSFGWSVSTAQLLRWVAGDETGHPAEYFRMLADALGEPSTPRPEVADPSVKYLARLDGWLELFDIIDDDPESWSIEARKQFSWEMREALFAVERGINDPDLSVEYPVELPCPARDDGSIASWLRADLGYALRLAADHAETAEEAQQLRNILNYYPDENLDIEVVTSAGEKFWISDLEVLYESVDDRVLLPEGSVHLDHRGDNSRYSPDSDEFEFRLHRPKEPESDDEDICFLVSPNLTYCAYIDDGTDRREQPSIAKLDALEPAEVADAGRSTPEEMDRILEELSALI